MYNLKKWYFDFLTPQNDYVFVYLAAVRLATATMRSLTVHMARPGKKVFVTRSIALPPEAPSGAVGEIQRLFGGPSLGTGKECVLAFSDEHCSVSLQYDAAEGGKLAPVIIPAGRNSSIRWQPLGLRRRVSGAVVLGAERVETGGTDGYMDYLESSCLPPLVPVRRLFWGRLACSGLSLAYMRAEAGKGARAWSALYGCVAEKSFYSDCVSIEPNDPSGPGGNDPLAAGEYSLCALNGTGDACLAVRPEAIVQEGSFVDQQEHTSRLWRFFLKLLTRNPRGAKFLARADVSCKANGSQTEKHDIPMICEYALL